MQIEIINEFIQNQLILRTKEKVTAVEAARWLDEAGILKDSNQRPGKNLRDLLREGLIIGQKQFSNNRWVINRVDVSTKKDKTGVKKGKNPPWERDELILALDLYFRHDPLHISDSHPEVVKLSKILNSLPIHQDRPDAIRFRNPNGVYMKLCNSYALMRVIMVQGYKEGENWKNRFGSEFADNPNHLREIAQGIIEGTFSVNSKVPINEDEE